MRSFVDAVFNQVLGQKAATELRILSLYYPFIIKIMVETISGV